MEPITLQDGTQLDPKVVKVMKAIRHVESGGDFEAVGDNGQSHGAYQWNKDNYKNAAKTILGNENAPMTKENQNKVAYTQMKKYKDEGKDPEEIAALWNGAHKDTSTGKYTYNNPEYGHKFRAALLGGQQSTEQSGTPDAPQYPFTSMKDVQTQAGATSDTPEEKHSGFLGTNPKGSLLEKATDNSITRGLIDIVPGAKTLGNYFGTSFGEDAEQIKGLVGGQDNSATYDKAIPSPLELAGATAGTLGTAAAIATGGTALASWMKGSTELAKPSIIKILQQALKPGEELSALSREGAATRLKAALERLPVTEVGGKLEQSILKALQELEPSLAQKSGLVSKGVGLAKNLAGKAAMAGLGRVVGDNVAGAVKGIYNHLK